MTIASDPHPKLFRFADHELDVQRHELRRQGRPVAAERKVFDLLVYLIENRDRAVDKQELQQAVWGRDSVTDAALTRCVMKARRLVGDDPKHQAIIKTIHGHGYHFVATLEETPGGEATVKPSPSVEEYREALWKPDRLSVAVLSLKNLGNDPDQEYFAEGITDDIVSELSRFSSLFVIASSSTKQLKDSPDSPPTLARRLGVAYLVQGSIRRSERRIRITVHLTEAASERRLWSENYDRELQEIPIIRDEVARSIAATIGGRVEAHREQQRFDHAGVQAYDLILRAKALHYGLSKTGNAVARSLLERAIELDPDNVRAHAWLASVHGVDGWYRYTADPEKSARLALEFGRKALEMDGSECVAHYVYGHILYSNGEYELAEAHFERALQLNPNDISARAAFSLLLVSTGRAEEALQHTAVVDRLDPFGLAWTPWSKGAVMFAVGRYPEAIRCLSQVENRDNLVRPWLAAAHARDGDTDQARLVLERFLSAARDEMSNFPGRDIELWQNYLRYATAYRDEADFQAFYRTLVDGGWLELVDALPGASDQHP